MREGAVDCSVVDRGMDEDLATSQRPERIGISVPQVRWSFDRNVAVDREPEQIGRGPRGYTPVAPKRVRNWLIGKELSDGRCLGESGRI